MFLPLHGMAQVSVATELRRVVHRHTCQRCQDRGGTGCPWVGFGSDYSSSLQLDGLICCKAENNGGFFMFLSCPVSTRCTILTKSHYWNVFPGPESYRTYRFNGFMTPSALVSLTGLLRTSLADVVWGSQGHMTSHDFGCFVGFLVLVLSW